MRKALASLFGNTSVSPNRLSGEFDNKLWIIDTGPTHHVTGNQSWLVDTTYYDCPVGLLNGASVISTMVGLVCLTAHITLKNVLFVPNLSCNLLYVSQLSDDVQFNSSMCIVQELTKALIGTGIRKGGMYYFVGNYSIHHVSFPSASIELWHQRIGHPSEIVVKLLLPLCNHKDSLDPNCEICFRSKHTRHKFPSCDTRASCIFEKIHCDLWGHIGMFLLVLLVIF